MMCFCACTHTPKHTLSLPLSLAFSLSFSHSLPRFLSLSLFPSFSLFRSVPHSLTHTHPNPSPSVSPPSNTGVKAAVVRADGHGSQFVEKGKGGAKGRGSGVGKPPHNRKVTFSVIQEIKIDGSIQFGAMSSNIGGSSESLLKKVVQVMTCTTSCGVLQRVAVLQHAAAHCNALQRTAQESRAGDVLQHAATRCNALQRAAPQFGARSSNVGGASESLWKKLRRRRTATRCNTLQHVQTHTYHA